MGLLNLGTLLSDNPYCWFPSAWERPGASSNGTGAGCDSLAQYSPADEVQGVVGSLLPGVMNDDVCTSYTESIHKNGLNLIEPTKTRQT